MRGVLDLSDLPGYEGTEDEGFPPLPPPGSPGQGGQDDGEPFASDAGEDADLSKLAEVPAAKRKGVKRPQPKLDSHRLISDRGLPALRSLFQDVQFKGKGHEAENLRLLMQKMENWAHRLYPKLQFEDFIDKVEKLGAKKEVQTCLKRIRLDMPLTHEDFTGEEAGLPDLQLSEDVDPFSRLVHSTPAPAEAPPPLASPAPPSLTEEQRIRMEQSRRRALERRLARQQLPDSQTVDSSQLQPTPPPAGVLQSTGEEEKEVEEEGGMMEVVQEKKMEEIEEEKIVEEEEKVEKEVDGKEDKKLEILQEEIEEEEKVEMVLEETGEEEEKEKVEKEVDEKEDKKLEMLQEEKEGEGIAVEENADFAPPPEDQPVGASLPQQQ